MGDKIAELIWENGGLCLRIRGVIVLREDDPCRDPKFLSGHTWSKRGIKRLAKRINEDDR